MTSRSPNFLEALFGLLAEPGSMTETLLEERRPPYTLTCVLCLMLTVGVPSLAHVYKNALETERLYNLPALASIFVVLLFTVFVFIVLESVLFVILRIAPAFTKLTALICYCLVPLIFGLWLIYLFNFLSDGELTVIRYALTGDPTVSDRFLRILPVAFLIIQINVFLVFFYGIRAIGGIGSVNAFAITLVSVVPFYTSLIIAIFLGELMREGTIEIFQRLLTSSSVPYL